MRPADCRQLSYAYCRQSSIGIKGCMFELAVPLPSSLSDLAVDRLREAIVVGHFKPGDRLVETKIPAVLGISRAPLREALRVLASDGLVEIRQNRGTYVVSPSGEELEN